MSNYQRFYCEGAYYFFTVVIYKRQVILTLPENISRLRSSFRHVKNNHPFNIEAIVILPDHLHCIWKMPDNDSNFSLRWRLIKRYFSIGMNNQVNSRFEKSIWQNRFWEHWIRDENDMKNHMDYIHYNPVKHGYSDYPISWPHSSLKTLISKGSYSKEWGESEPGNIIGLDLD